MRSRVLPGEQSAEVLRDEVTVGQHDEAVVGKVTRELAAREHGEIWCEPVRVVAEHDVERSVRVRGDSAGPGRAAGQGLGTGEGLQRHRIDALDPTRRVGAELVAEEEHFSRLPEDGHRRADRRARMHADFAGDEAGPGCRR